MNFFNILDSIEKVDGEVYERLEHATRRHFLHRVSQKVAATAGVTLFTSILAKTYAQTPTAVSVLEFALTLEYLEAEFYNKGNEFASAIFTGDYAKYMPVFEQIRKHENAHVKLLTDNGISVMKPEFDFTAGGAYSPFTKFGDFVFLSHAFEDTGVRAYKGQAPLLNAPADKPFLEVALQIHSVEAKHAAVTRKILSEVRMDPTIKPWITGSKGSPAPVYAADDVLTQAGINLLDFTGVGIPDDKLVNAATEAFDEDLIRPKVVEIASLFFKK